VTEILRDRALLHGPPEAVWAILEDPAALARVLPGAESIEALGARRFRGVLASRIQFLTVRADVEAALEDADPPRSVRLVIDGRPRGLAGRFTVAVPFELAPVTHAEDAAATEVRYAVDLTVSGRLATFGMPLLRDTLRRQIAALVANVERELEQRPGPGTDQVA